MMPTGAARHHAGFPFPVPKPLMSRSEGLPSRNGAPPSSLPTTSSSCTSLAGREGFQGFARCSGPQEPPSQEGWLQAGFSLPLLPRGSRSARSSRTEQAHSSVSYGVRTKEN